MEDRKALMIPILMIIFAFGFVSISTNVNAYKLEGVKWAVPMDICYWYMNLTGTDYVDARLAVTNIEDIPANFHLVQNYEYRDIEFYSVRRSDANWVGLCQYAYSGSYFIWAKIYINDYYTDSYARQKRQSVIAHELGHGLGLDHEVGPVLMNSNINHYDDDKICVAVWDDVKGLQYLYSTSTTTAQPYNYKSANGHISYGGTNGYPEHIWVSPSGVNQYAVVYEEATSLPLSGTLTMYSKVKGSTLFEFAMGIYISLDPSNRMMTAEITNNAFKLSRTGASSTIPGVSPSANVEYALVLVIEDGLPSWLYVIRTSDNAWIGKTSLSLGNPWSTSVHFSNGVWTTSSSDPASNYYINAWWNDKA